MKFHAHFLLGVHTAGGAACKSFLLLFFGSGTAESPISHLVRTVATATAAAAACVQQILNHVIG